MTQPDAYFPDKATNAGSFAAFAAKPQSEWEAEMRGAEEDRWGLGILSPLFDGLQEGMSFTLSILTTLGRQILGIPDMIWNTVEELVDDIPILGGIADLIQQIIDAVVNALTGGSGTGNDPSAILFALVNRLVAIPGELFAGLQAAIAALTGRVNAISPPRQAVLSEWTNFSGPDLTFDGGYMRTTSISRNYYNTPAETDKHGVNFTVGGGQSGLVRVGICGSTTLDTYAAVEVFKGFYGNDAVRIVTGGGAVLQHKVKDYGGWGRAIPDGTVFDVKYDPDPNLVIVELNGTQILEWEDTDGLLIHDADHRLAVLVSNALNGNVWGTYGFGVTYVNVYDW